MRSPSDPTRSVIVSFGRFVLIAIPAIVVACVILILILAWPQRVRPMVVHLPEGTSGMLWVVEGDHRSEGVTIERDRVELDFTQSRVLFVEDIELLTGWFRQEPRTASGPVPRYDPAIGTGMGPERSFSSGGVNVSVQPHNGTQHSYRLMPFVYCFPDEQPLLNAHAADRSITELLENPELLELPPH